MIEFRDVIDKPQNYLSKTISQVKNIPIDTLKQAHINEMLKKIHKNENITIAELFKIIDTDKNGKISK